jgi:IS1 family transposase
MSIRSVERITGVHRDTIMRLGARVGRGCFELHDRTMVGLRVGRIECDELWAFVGKKQKQTRRHEFTEGDQYTFVALASSAKAILSYHTGKRDNENTDLFIQDLRERALGAPEFSTDGWSPYQNAIRDALGLGDGYHLHPDGARLRLSGRCARLVQPSRAVVAPIDHDGGGVLRRDA